MRKGWFVIPGVQRGDRTLKLQMVGLAAALAECPGKRVLDLGCAEGLIGREFARAGALEVFGVDCNMESVEVARTQCAGLPCTIECVNLGRPGLLPPGPWQIVLALAILHKLKDPPAIVSAIAEMKPELVVVRLPGGSKGCFVTKTYATPCDLNQAFKAAGFQLSATAPGPNDELVQYWRP